MIILILSYACEPNGASEYGVGWNVPTTMAMRYPDVDIYVVTRSKFRDKIEEQVGTLFKGGRLTVRKNEICISNLHFLFYDLSKWMMWPHEERSHWGEQVNYGLWQMKVGGFIKKWQKNSKVKFDVVHHLTYNQYRTPSPGYWMDIPFVVGPIGGGECIDPVFYQDLTGYTLRKEKIRRAGKDLKLFRWFNTRSKNKKIILCSSKENYERLKPYCGDSEIRKMAAIGVEERFGGLERLEGLGRLEGFCMLCPCKAWDWKGILIFLRSVRKLKDTVQGQGIKVILVGIRFEEEKNRVNGWIEELGLEKEVEVIPFMQRDELLNLETGCDVVVYPAFRDSGSMAVLEACSLEKPVICFDAGGQDIFPDDILIKIPIGKSYEENVRTFADRLLWAMHHKDERKEIGRRAKKWVDNNLTWEKKVDKFINIYNEMKK